MRRARYRKQRRQGFFLLPGSIRNDCTPETTFVFESAKEFEMADSSKTLQIRRLTANDALAASQLHSSWGRVGLHSVFGLEFLEHFYARTISTETLYVVGAFLPSGEIIGVGFLVLEPNFLKILVKDDPLKIALLFLKRLPFLLRMPRRLLSLVRETLKPGTHDRSPESVELGFIVVARNKEASQISKRIFETLCARACEQSFKKMTSVVSSGHHASLLMHSALGFRAVGKRDQRVHFEMNL